MKENTIIQSQGGRFRELLLPKFELKNGAMLTISWPLMLGSKTESIFYKCIQNKKKIPNLSVRGRICVAKDDKYNGNQDLSTLSEFLDILRNAGVTVTLSERGLSSNSFIKKMSLSMRRLFSIVESYFTNDCVVFNTCGLDPSGERDVLKVVQYLNKNGTAFVYFRFPVVVSDDADLTVGSLVVVDHY